MNLLGLQELSELGPAALLHVAAMEDLLRQIAEQTSQRKGEAFTYGEAGNAPGAGAAFTLAGTTRIPIGKRLNLERVTTTAPANSGPCAIYASPSQTVAGDNLREVIAAPQLYADAVQGGTIIRGGSFLVAVFTVVPTAGICTVRYEGELYDDTHPADGAYRG